MNGKRFLLQTRILLLKFANFLALPTQAFIPILTENHVPDSTGDIRRSHAQSPPKYVEKKNPQTTTPLHCTITGRSQKRDVVDSRQKNDSHLTPPSPRFLFGRRRIRSRPVVIARSDCDKSAGAPTKNERRSTTTLNCRLSQSPAERRMSVRAARTVADTGRIWRTAGDVSR